MSEHRKIGPGLFAVAGPDLTDPRDAAAYLVADRDRLALIDCGAGPSYPDLVSNLRSTGHDPERLEFLIATHAHIDHIGALASFKRDFPLKVAAHSLEAPAIETADRKYTAATWYDLPLEPVEVDIKLQGETSVLELGESVLTCLHTPGHTPGSIVVYLDRGGRRYLFGQDIHGPFSSDFNSNLDQWRRSMTRLLDLEADVLAEGHYGVIDGAPNTAAFINRFLDEYQA